MVILNIMINIFVSILLICMVIINEILIKKLVKIVFINIFIKLVDNVLCFIIVDNWFNIFGVIIFEKCMKLNKIVVFKIFFVKYNKNIFNILVGLIIL